MTSLAKSKELLIMDTSNSLGSDEGTRYFFQKLHDFPRWKKCLPFLMAHKPTFPYSQSLFFQFYWDLVLPKLLELSESAALSTTLSPGKLHRDMKEWVKPAYENLPEAEFSLI